MATSIEIKETSNPAILKFEADRFLTQHSSYEFNNIDEASASPLAQQLFHLPFVKKVYIASNFIAIERYNIVEWSEVQEDVKEVLETYLSQEQPVVTEAPKIKVASAVTIYAESTPNPAVLKFVCNKALTAKVLEFNSIDEAKPSPLAIALFQFPFVKSVFIDKNYVSVTKYDIAEWEEITQELRTFIKTYLEEEKPVLDENISIQKEKVAAEKETEFEKLDDISKEIVNILEEYVKPAVQSDGGNIEFKSFDESTKTVEVILQGACSGCPSSTFTLKNGIENMLKQMLNDAHISVEAINQ
jgi:Fe-S cluster biogenesis protein NfuA/predicted nucleic-acid-binding protein